MALFCLNPHTKRHLRACPNAETENARPCSSYDTHDEVVFLSLRPIREMSKDQVLEVGTDVGHSGLVW